MTFRIKRTVNVLALKNLLVPKRSTLEIIGELVRDRIVMFTRRGKSIVGETPESLKKLKESTKKSRLSFNRNNKTDEFFSPGKSNLTLTGQLLKSLKWKSNAPTGEVVVFASGRRTDGKSNEDVARFVSESGRPFIGLDKKGVDRVKRELVRAFRNNLRRNRSRR